MKPGIIGGMFLVIGLAGGYWLHAARLPDGTTLAPHDLHTLACRPEPPLDATGRDQARQLAEANRRIAELNARNAALSSQLAKLILPGVSSLTYPELLKRIDTLPPDFLKTQWLYLFDKAGLDKVHDVRAFSKRMAGVLLDQDGGISDSDPRISTLYFSTSPIYGTRMIGQSAEVPKHSPIFAHMNADRPAGEVMVKWQNLTTGELLMVRNFSLEESDPYVWLAPSQGWTPGAYRVDVFAMDDEVTPLASRTLTITSVFDAESTSRGDRHSEVIQDLLSSGRAAPKLR